MNDDNLTINTILICILLCLASWVGFAYGRQYQCEYIGAEYANGKCVTVTRTEVKP